MVTNSLGSLAAAAKLLQSCPTLCDPIHGSTTGSTVPGILQARILEWVAISFSNAWKWKVKVKSLSCVWLLETPWTAAYQAPPSMGFSRQEYWTGVPLPSPLGSLTEMQFLTSNSRVSDSVGKGSKFAFLTGLQVIPWTFLVAQMVKHLPTVQETWAQSLIPGSGRSPGEGNGNLLQYSCLENPMDGEVWWATVCGVAKSRTWWVTSFSLSQVMLVLLTWRSNLENYTTSKISGVCVYLPEACPDDPPVWMTHLGCLDGFSPSKVPIPFSYHFLRKTAPILILLPKIMMVVVLMMVTGTTRGMMMSLNFLISKVEIKMEIRRLPPLEILDLLHEKTALCTMPGK